MYNVYGADLTAVFLHCPATLHKGLEELCVGLQVT